MQIVREGYVPEVYVQLEQRLHDGDALFDDEVFVSGVMSQAESDARKAAMASLGIVLVAGAGDWALTHFFDSARYLELFPAVLLMSAQAAFFGPAHRLLRSRVSIKSAGFWMVVAAFFGAAVIRHALAFGAPLQSFLLEHSVFFAFVLWIAGMRRLSEVTLYMCTSTGVDVAVGAFALATGTTSISTDARYAILGWEALATLVAIVRLHIGFRRSTTVDAAR